MGLKIVNGAWGTLAGSIGSGDVTANLTAGHGARFGSFSAGDYMYCTLIKVSSNETEHIKITARSTDALTIVRGLDGSTAIAFSAGDRIECCPINAAVRAASQEIVAVELSGTNTYTGTLDPVPTGYNTGQLYLLGVANTNTSGAPTVNLNSLGAKNVSRLSGNVQIGDIPRRALFMYDGTNMVLLNPAVSSQRVEATPYTTYSSSSVSIPNDDTIPQNTEGLEILTAAITPKHASNRLVIEAQVHMSGDASRTLIAALFQDSAADALAVSAVTSPAVGNVMTVRLRHEMAAGTTSATTFRIRVGTTSGTFYVNGTNAARSFGGKLACTLSVSESF